MSAYGFGKVIVSADYGKKVMSISSRSKSTTTSVGPSGFIQNGTGYIGGGASSTVTSNYSEVTVQSQFDGKRSVVNEFSSLPLREGDVVIPIFAEYVHENSTPKSLFVAAIIEGSKGAHQLMSVEKLIEKFELKAGIFGSLFQGKKDVSQFLTTEFKKSLADIEYGVEMANKLGGYTHACMLFDGNR